jgi:AraC-like DNA-binding protein
MVDDKRNRSGNRPVTYDDLFELADETNARTFSIATPHLSRGDTAILGRLENLRCHSGLFVHATDTVEAHDLETGWEKPPACSVVVMLEGELDAYLDDRRVHLGPAGQGGATGHIWALVKPTRVTRRSRKGTRVRKVVITVPWDWIEEILKGLVLPNANLARFTRSHRAHVVWRPSARAVALAEQIVNSSQGGQVLAHMSVESRAIEIVREALESIIAAAPEAGPSPPPTGPHSKAQSKAIAVRDHLRAHIEDNPSLKSMARDLGMSIGAMQGAFKAVYGRTIADYSRELRLQRAREAMERDGISVAQAAYEAGYSNPANFSTAFKRLFGLSPRDVQA